MCERLRKKIQQSCHILENVIAVLVLIGIVLSIISLVTNLELFHRLLTSTASFKHYLEQIFTIVIGVEFLQMLCRPNSDNVIEILIFLVARHMIIGDTTPYQDFVSVISVALLCIIRRYLRNMKDGVSLQMMLENRHGRKVQEKRNAQKEEQEKEKNSRQTF